MGTSPNLRGRLKSSWRLKPRIHSPNVPTQTQSNQGFTNLRRQFFPYSRDFGRQRDKETGP